jgi:hypothetical protein
MLNILFEQILFVNQKKKTNFILLQIKIIVIHFVFLFLNSQCKKIKLN